MSIDGRLLYIRIVQPNSVQIVRPGERPAACIKDPFETLHIYLPAAFLIRCLSAEGIDGGQVEIRDPMAAVDIAIGKLSTEIRSEMSLGQPLSKLRIDALGQDLAIQLLRRHSSLAYPRLLTLAARGGLAPWQQRRCCEYLRDRVAEDVSLDELAGLAGLSVFHFARMFKLSTGLPPHAYQCRLRCERAHELLLTTDLSVLEVALSVGYDTPQAFARMFRAETGATPSAWRRERRS